MHPRQCCTDTRKRQEDLPSARLPFLRHSVPLSTRYVFQDQHLEFPSCGAWQIGAGYTNEQGAKVAVSSTELAPAGIILDAELTLATPERLW